MAMRPSSRCARWQSRARSTRCSIGTPAARWSSACTRAGASRSARSWPGRDVPIWLDHVALKAIALDRKQRFETAEEMVLALERGASRPLAAPGATPLVARDPAALWKIAFGVSLLFNALLVYWLLFLT